MVGTEVLLGDLLDVRFLEATMRLRIGGRDSGCFALLHNGSATWTSAGRTRQADADVRQISIYERDNR